MQSFWMPGVQGIKASNSSWEGDFPRYGSSTSTRCRQANGSTPFAFALSTMEYTTALASAPLGVSQNSKFLRPRVNGRMAFSARLGDI